MMRGVPGKQSHCHEYVTSINIYIPSFKEADHVYVLIRRQKVSKRTLWKLHRILVFNCEFINISVMDNTPLTLLLASGSHAPVQGTLLQLCLSRRDCAQPGCTEQRPAAVLIPDMPCSSHP